MTIQTVPYLHQSHWHLNLQLEFQQQVYQISPRHSVLPASPLCAWTQGGIRYPSLIEARLTLVWWARVLWVIFICLCTRPRVWVISILWPIIENKFAMQVSFSVLRCLHLHLLLGCLQMPTSVETAWGTEPVKAQYIRTIGLHTRLSASSLNRMLRIRLLFGLCIRKKVLCELYKKLLLMPLSCSYLPPFTWRFAFHFQHLPHLHFHAVKKHTM